MESIDIRYLKCDKRVVFGSKLWRSEWARVPDRLTVPQEKRENMENILHVSSLNISTKKSNGVNSQPERHDCPTETA